MSIDIKKEILFYKKYSELIKKYEEEKKEKILKTYVPSEEERQTCSKILETGKCEQNFCFNCVYLNSKVYAQ